MSLSIFEASIEDLQSALEAGEINAVQLLAKHLHRVAQYDRRGPKINAIPVINPLLFEEAEASDDYRARTGNVRSRLEGIPCVVKDSYMFAGLTVASGSPAFENLTVSEDAFTVHVIRSGGGLALGKTNMPPMANGGMQRGVYGRAESPYNGDYLTAAYASGSSNGAASAASANMAVFGMGEETVSSGRSPASNNGLVAYTPSRGLLSIRGNWPLFPVADVVVPLTRSVSDMLTVLDILMVKDDKTIGDFWRGQPFIELPDVEAVRPKSFQMLADPNALKGKRIGAPKMYIGETDPDAQPVYIRPSVRVLWESTRKTLESLGATVAKVGFPLVTNYELKPDSVAWETEYPLPESAHSPAPLDLAPYAWDDFLRMVNDTTSVTTLGDVNPASIFPQLPGTLPDRYGNVFLNRTEINEVYVGEIRPNRTGVYEIPGLNDTLQYVEATRKTDFEDWLDDQSLDLLVWPSQGDVGPEDAETNDTAAVIAWRNGVFFSNGNYAIRQFGVPTVSVSMGAMEDTKMPVSLTFAGKAYDDAALLSYSYAFEKARKGRFAAPRTPELETDLIPSRCINNPQNATIAPTLAATATRIAGGGFRISGSVNALRCGGLESLEVYLDGVSVGDVKVTRCGRWMVSANITLPYEASDPFALVNKPPLDRAMIVVVATGINRRSAGKLIFA
ncbi:amidase signature enzyme [Thozetella sp. PMI_491]|nr:amidase signature enzyme [Thozetella sp. PMI_491]